MIVRVIAPSFMSFISFHSALEKPTPGNPLLDVKIIRPFWSYQVSDSYFLRLENQANQTASLIVPLSILPKKFNCSNNIGINTTMVSW